MAEETSTAGNDGEDGHNAAHQYREYYERTQRFIMGIPEQHGDLFPDLEPGQRPPS